MPLAQPFETLLERKDQDRKARVTLAISCFKYGREATEALDSLLSQTERVIDVVIVDDCSPDDSAQVVLDWFGRKHWADKFANVVLVKHGENHGLAQSRNTALSLTLTPYIFILDADNQLYPRAIETLRQALESSGCAMAYSLVEKFGAQQDIMNNTIWLPEKFSYGNYIDAMALVRTDVLRELGGYREMPNKFGWEDYDLWCSFVDRGLRGCHVPQILCRYRVHEASMLRTSTNAYVEEKLRLIREDFESHHKMLFYFGYPWSMRLRLLLRSAIYQTFWLLYAVRNLGVTAYRRSWTATLGATGESAHGRQGLLRRLVGKKFLARLRQSERQVYDWQQSLPTAQRSAVLHVYFRVFGAP